MDKEERVALASAELEAVSTQLRDARKILRRDWESLAPRERSERSRHVRELESQQVNLLAQIEMDSAP